MVPARALKERMDFRSDPGKACNLSSVVNRRCLHKDQSAGKLMSEFRSIIPVARV